MIQRIKSILFVVCVVMVFTAQTKPTDDKKQEHASGARPAAKSAPSARPAAAARPAPAAHNNQSRPQAQARSQAPRQTAHAALPRVEAAIPVPLDERRGTSPRVYATPASAPVGNNRLLNRQHHNNWQPRYNFYDNQYHFYPYINVTSPVELSANCITVLFNGQTYYYDNGSFYVQDPQGDLAVAPPVGIIVPAIPDNAHQINVNGQIYYRSRGIFYVQVPQGYQVIGPVEYVSDGS